MTCTVPLRAIRANTGMVPIPIATIAVMVDGPNTAANMIASNSAGNASSRSLPRSRTRPGNPGAMPIMIPSGVPTRPATPTDTIPTNRVVRAPTISRDSTSRPNWSVPSRLDHPGPANRLVPSTK